MSKILVFDKYLGYQVGGAQKSLHGLIAGMKADIDLLGCEMTKSFSAKSLKMDKLKVQRFAIKEFRHLPYLEYFLNRSKVKKQIKNKKANLLITQGLWGAMAISAFSGPSVYFVRDEYQLNNIRNYNTGFKKIVKYLYLLVQLPFILIMFSDNSKAIKKANLVVANSEYIKKRIKNKFGVDAQVIYPLIDVRKMAKTQIAKASKRKYIVSFGSELIKGSAITEQIAGRMRKNEFMIVGRDYTTRSKKGNITYEPWARDVESIYRNTKLLLVPSIWDEAFGRVIVEALAYGIPVVGSKKGGIPEILDDLYLVENPYSVTEWLEMIKLAAQDFDKMQEFKDMAKKYDMKDQIQKFRNLVNNGLKK